jgi:Tfp pilus assembly protein PilF
MHRTFQSHLPHTLAGFVLLIALVFLNPRSAHGQEVQGVPSRGVRTVSGQVVTEGEAVVPSGVTIVIEMRDGKRSGEIHPDAQGRFEVPGLFRQTYLMTVTAEGFFPQELLLDLKDGEGPVVLQIVMHRAPRAKKTSPPPALTDQSAPKDARKVFQKGVHALQANQVDEAREKFQRAVAEYPCYARALTGLASIQIAARDLESASANLHQAVRCDPGFPDACALLGKVLNNQKKFAESEEILKQGLRLSPDAWQLYDQLATAHYNEGQYGKAQEEWLRVLAIDPAPPAELHAKLAAVYLQGGARDKAYTEMQAYLRAEPAGRFASTFKAMMARQGPSGAHGATSPQPEPSAIPNP